MSRIVIYFLHLLELARQVMRIKLVLLFYTGVTLENRAKIKELFKSIEKLEGSPIGTVDIKILYILMNKLNTFSRSSKILEPPLELLSHVRM